MLYMLIPKIYSEHASLVYIVTSAPHLGSRTICSHCYREDHQ
jgi:hypothetical protein